MMFRIVFWDILPCKMIVIPDDGGSTHLWNVGRQTFYTAVYHRRQFWTKFMLCLRDKSLNHQLQFFVKVTVKEVYLFYIFLTTIAYWNLNCVFDTIL
jgi:hypothetical protein